MMKRVGIDSCHRCHIVTCVTMVVLWVTCISTVLGYGNMMPIGSGWRVCGYSFSDIEGYPVGRYGDSPPSLGGWRNSLIGVSELPDFGCNYYDVLDFKLGKDSFTDFFGMTSYFAVVAQGHFEVDHAGTYQWKICGDDGVLIYIDGVVLSTDGWVRQADKCYDQEKALAVGTHDIEVVFYEYAGHDSLRLYGGPGKSTLVAEGNLHQVLSSPEGVGWRVCGYSLTGLKNGGRYGESSTTSKGWRDALRGVSEDPVYGCYFYQVLDFSQGWPAHRETGMEDRFVVTAEGHFEVSDSTSGTYRWRVCGDDGMVIYIDGVALETDSWRLQPHTCHQTQGDLAAGHHTITVVMYTWDGEGRLTFSGGPVGTSIFQLFGVNEEVMSAPAPGICYNGTRYFTLGDDFAVSSSPGCQNRAKALPAGSVLAPNAPETLGLVRWSNLDADCLVLADGSSHKTASSLSDGVRKMTYSLDLTANITAMATVSSLKAEKEISTVGWGVSLQSMVCNGNTCTWTYNVTVADWEENMSHWVLEMSPGCNVVSSDFLGINLDLSTGLMGVRSRDSIRRGAGAIMSFDTIGNMGTVIREYAVAGTSYFASGKIMGPLCGNSEGTSVRSVSTFMLDVEDESTICGKGKLLSPYRDHYAADCGDGMRHRVLARKSGCDPGDMDLATPAAITNYVTLKGRRYATIDNRDPHEVPGAGACAQQPSGIPAGWSIAPFNNENMLVNLFGNGVLKFGTRCMIYSDGKGRSTSPDSFGSICAVNAIEALDLPGGPLLRALNFCGRIMITQDAPPNEQDTLVVDPPGSFASIARTNASVGYFYGTIDNTPKDVVISSCQSSPFSLPEGWELVPSNDDASLIYRHYPFGTSCVVAENGEGIPSRLSFSGCGSNLLYSLSAFNTTYYTVRGCNSRVGIRYLQSGGHGSSGLSETCGICTARSTIHMSTFDRTGYTSSVGDQVLRVLSPNPNVVNCSSHGDPQYYCDFDVYSWQVGHGDMASTRAVMVRHVGSTGDEETISVIVDHTIKRRSNLPHVEVNHTRVVISAENSTLRTGQGAVITLTHLHDGRLKWRIMLANAVEVEILSFFAGQPLLEYKVTLPKRFAGSHAVFGLCGDCDGNHGNDFYIPFNNTHMDKETIVTRSWEDRKVVIHNIFITSNSVNGSNPFLPDSQPMPVASQVDSDGFAFCHNASRKVLDLVDRCCVNFKGDDYRHCQENVCVHRTCSSVEFLKDGQLAPDEMIFHATNESWSCNQTKVVHTVEMPAIYGGREYAVLDGAANIGRSIAGSWQSEYLAVPDGWLVAERDEINLAVSSCITFGAECLIFSDGSGVSTDGTFSTCGTELMLKAGSNGECLRPVAANMRILIVKDLSIAVKDFLDSSDPSFWLPLGDAEAISEVSDEDPNGNQIFRVTTNSMVTQGIFRTLGPMPTPSGLQFTKETKPFSASIWARRSNSSSFETSASPSEWYYVEADISLDNGDTLSTRTSSFSRSTDTAASSGWERVVLDLNLPKLYAQRYSAAVPNAKVASITIRMAASRMVGFVDFGVPVFGISHPEQFNLVENGYFNHDVLPDYKNHSMVTEGWVATSGSPAVDMSTSVAGLGNDVDGGSGALKLTDQGQQQASLSHRFKEDQNSLYDETCSDTLMICTWHRAENLGGVESSGSSLYVDFLSGRQSEATTGSNSSSRYGQVIPLRLGTTGWYHSCRRFETPGYTTRHMVISARMTQGQTSSQSFFDGVFAMPSCMGNTNLDPAAVTFGDPHLVTGDGAQYSIQGLGEYNAFVSDDVRVQQRHVAAGSASVVSAIAMTQEASGIIVQIDRPDPHELEATIRVNGQRISNSPRTEFSLRNASVVIRRSGNLVPPSQAGFGSIARFVVTMMMKKLMWAQAEGAAIEETFHSAIEVTLQNTQGGNTMLGLNIPTPRASSNPAGLFGNFNGVIGDEFVGPDGTPYTNALSNPTQLDAFAESWRVKNAADSLFTYQAWESIDTYYAATFVPFSLDSASAAALSNAKSGCELAGVSAKYMDVCVYDVLAGGDEYFVGAAGLSSSYSHGETQALYDPLSSEGGDGDSDGDSDDGSDGVVDGSSSGHGDDMMPLYVVLAALAAGISSFGVLCMVLCCILQFMICAIALARILGFTPQRHHGVKPTDLALSGRAIKFDVPYWSDEILDEAGGDGSDEICGGISSEAQEVVAGGNTWGFAKMVDDEEGGHMLGTPTEENLPSVCGTLVSVPEVRGTEVDQISV